MPTSGLLDFGTFLELGLKKRQLDIQQDNAEAETAVRVMGMALEQRAREHEASIRDQQMALQIRNAETQRKRDEAEMDRARSEQSLADFRADQMKAEARRRDVDIGLAERFSKSPEYTTYKDVSSRMSAAIMSQDWISALKHRDSLRAGWTGSLVGSNDVLRGLKEQKVGNIPAPLDPPEVISKELDTPRFVVRLPVTKKVKFDYAKPKDGDTSAPKQDADKTETFTEEKKWSINDVHDNMRSGSSDAKREAWRVLAGEARKDAASMEYVMSLAKAVPAEERGALRLDRIDPTLDGVDQGAIDRFFSDSTHADYLAAYKAGKKIEVKDKKGRVLTSFDPGQTLRETLQKEGMSPLTIEKALERPAASAPGSPSGSTRIDLGSKPVRDASNPLVVAKAALDRWDTLKTDTERAAFKTEHLEGLRASLKDAASSETTTAHWFTGKQKQGSQLATFGSSAFHASVLAAIDPEFKAQATRLGQAAGIDSKLMDAYLSDNQEVINDMSRYQKVAIGAAIAIGTGGGSLLVGGGLAGTALVLGGGYAGSELGSRIVEKESGGLDETSDLWIAVPQMVTGATSTGKALWTGFKDVARASKTVGQALKESGALTIKPRGSGEVGPVKEQVKAVFKVFRDSFRNAPASEKKAVADAVTSGISDPIIKKEVQDITLTLTREPTKELSGAAAERFARLAKVNEDLEIKRRIEMLRNAAEVWVE